MRLKRLCDEFWDAKMRAKPLWATLSGYGRYDDKLEDHGARGRDQSRRTLTALLARSQALDASSLTSAERLTRRVLLHQLEADLAHFEHRHWEFEVDGTDGPQTRIASLVAMAQPMADELDAQRLLRRMEEFPRFFDEQIANLDEGLAAGRAGVASPVDRTIEQLRAQLALPPERTPFADAAARLPGRLRPRLGPLIEDAVRRRVNPAYERYLRYLETYRRRARPDDRPGLCHLPGGEAAYGERIRFRTTLDLRPDDIHRGGVSDLESLKEEMRAVAGRLGHRGSLPEIFDAVRRDPRAHFDTPEQMVRESTQLVERLNAGLPRYFGRLPKTPCVVKPVEPFRERSAPSGQYYSPPDDLSRPGIFQINTFEPENRERFVLAALTAHETVPGHHLQIALAAENRALPLFQRRAAFTAYIEGWALYAERLADEMGVYEEDFSRLGMLMEQAFRACRLVVDTGLHAQGWSREQAIVCMLESLPMSRLQIEAEVDRYVVWPGQALAYKIGQREIEALRREREKVLGPAFDLRAFHDAVLAHGPLPMPLLRQVVTSSA